MHEHQPDDPEVLSEIEQLGYDPRDVPVGNAWKHAVGLFVSCFVMGLVGLGIMLVFDRIQGSKTIGKQPLPERRAMPQEPYPLLQSNLTAKTDIHDLRKQEKIGKNTAGWVDEAKGIARIPVSVAMEKILSEGMPSTAGQAEPASVTGVDPSAPGTAVDSTLHTAGGGQ